MRNVAHIHIESTGVLSVSSSLLLLCYVVRTRYTEDPSSIHRLPVQQTRRGSVFLSFLFLPALIRRPPFLILMMCILLSLSLSFSLLCVCVFLGSLSLVECVRPSVCVCVYAIVRITELERVRDHANRSINRCLTSSIIRAIVEKLSHSSFTDTVGLFCCCYYYYYYIFLGRRKSLLLLLLLFFSPDLNI